MGSAPVEIICVTNTIDALSRWPGPGGRVPPSCPPTPSYLVEWDFGTKKPLPGYSVRYDPTRPKPGGKSLPESSTRKLSSFNYKLIPFYLSPSFIEQWHWHLPLPATVVLFFPSPGWRRWRRSQFMDNSSRTATSSLHCTTGYGQLQQCWGKGMLEWVERKENVLWLTRFLRL